MPPQCINSAAMSALLTVLPLLVLLAALLLKRGAVASSLLGSGAVLAVVLFDARFAFESGRLLATDLPIVLILTLSVALVIVPGQILNAQLQAAGVITALGRRIERLPLSRMKLASVIVLGIAPALESLTGFGVSLFFTVPVLLQLFSARTALFLALLGMNIMPWGTLALATLIGAQIAGAPFADLAFATSLTSCAVFPVIGVLVFAVCRAAESRAADLAFPLLTGLALSACLVFYNAFISAELAGVCAGLSAATLALLFETLRRGPGVFAAAAAAKETADADDAPLLRLLSPYLILVALIAVSRLAPVNDALHNLLRLESGGVMLAVFTNPGVFIALTALALGARAAAWRAPGVLAAGAKRAIYPVAAIALFVMFAQLHRASGIFEALAAKLVELTAAQTAFIAPLFGMVGGYATGSNVGGNALFMALQSDAGRHFGDALLFAAAQNSAAGHAVFMSLPIILLALSIAAPADAKGAQAWLVRRALMCAPLIYAALALPFYLLIR